MALYNIREATESDSPQLSILITQLGYPTTTGEEKTRFSSISNNPDYHTLVITLNEEVIGAAGLVKGFWYEKNGQYIRILIFVIREDKRGLRAGKILISAVEEWATGVGANAVLLSSGNRDERMGAHRFYQSLGYQIKSSGFIKQL